MKRARKKRQEEMPFQRRERAQAVAVRLKEALPHVQVPLIHRNPFELLMATILSAQSTDEQVNRVTPELFRCYPDAVTLAAASLTDIEKRIRSLGLFRSKARALKETATQLVGRHQGKVPSRMEELTRLRGVGRKTANVVLGHAFGVPGIVVDTHVQRLAKRLGLTRQGSPDKIEAELSSLLPEGEWSAFSLRLILHGRRICQAKKPRCDQCVLKDLCPSAETKL